MYFAPKLCIRSKFWGLLMFFNFFFWIFGAWFQLKIPTYLSGRILLSLLKLKNKLPFLKVKTKFSWTNMLEFWAENMPQKSKKKKLKNIRSPQNFDLMHTLWKYTYTSQVKPDYLPKSQVGDLNEPCQLIISIHMFDPQWHFWGWSDFALDFLPERCERFGHKTTTKSLHY